MIWIVLIIAIALLAGQGVTQADPDRPKPSAPEPNQFDFENWLKGAMWFPKTKYVEFVNAAAIRFGVPNALIESVCWVESADGVNTAGSAGEIGIMQILPATVQDIKSRMPSTADLSANTVQGNIMLGTAYLRLNYAQLGSWRKATVAYNSGPGSQRVNNPADWYFLRVEARLKEVLES